MITISNVGTYTLKNAETFRNLYEFAAWYREIEVQPGVYPVNALVDGGYVKWFTVSLPGVVVASDFSSHFGGVRFGSKIDEDKGQPGTYPIQINDYLVLEALGKPDSRWTIDLSALPHIGNCFECGAAVTLYADQPRRCTTCSVRYSNGREAFVKAKYPRIVALLNRTDRNIGAYLLSRYLEEKKDGGKAGYHARQVAASLKLRDGIYRARCFEALAARLSEENAYLDHLGVSRDLADWTVVRDDWRWIAKDRGTKRFEFGYWQKEDQITVRS